MLCFCFSDLTIHIKFQKPFTNFLQSGTKVKMDIHNSVIMQNLVAVQSKISLYSWFSVKLVHDRLALRAIQGFDIWVTDVTINMKSTNLCTKLSSNEVSNNFSSKSNQLSFFGSKRNFSTNKIPFFINNKAKFGKRCNSVIIQNLEVVQSNIS